MNDLIQLTLLAVASGAISLTLTASHLTKRWRHEWLDAPYLMGELINCPYCMGHWTAVPFALYVGQTFADVVLSYWIIVGLSALFMGAAQRLFLFRESENEELRELLREARETVRDLVEEKS